MHSVLAYEVLCVYIWQNYTLSTVILIIHLSLQIIFFTLVACSAAAPGSYLQETRDNSEGPLIPILRSEVNTPNEDGDYNFSFETADGISQSVTGRANDAGAVGSYGTIKFPLPNGEQFELRFVANENGYVAESDYLPVAPAFPHPIPQFVIDQINKAERERADAAARQADESSSRYEAPPVQERQISQPRTEYKTPTPWVEQRQAAPEPTITEHKAPTPWVEQRQAAPQPTIAEYKAPTPWSQPNNPESRSALHNVNENPALLRHFGI